ncbi:MAG: hypothetical protein E6302_11455, partial [Enterobacter sp.]|nr:hypothetical protein [Enterobacter sp.]
AFMLSPLLRRYTWNSTWLYNVRIFIALWPVGRRVVPVEVAQAAREANARRRFQ